MNSPNGSKSASPARGIRRTSIGSLPPSSSPTSLIRPCEPSRLGGRIWKAPASTSVLRPAWALRYACVTRRSSERWGARLAPVESRNVDRLGYAFERFGRTFPDVDAGSGLVGDCAADQDLFGAGERSDAGGDDDISTGEIRGDRDRGSDVEADPN